MNINSDGAEIDAARDMQNDGMTLRDYFATHASEEDIKYWQPTGELVERVAVTSSGKVVYQESGKYTREQARYWYAEAMLKARKV